LRSYYRLTTVLNAICTVGQVSVLMLVSVLTFVFRFVTRQRDSRSSEKTVGENRLDQGVLDVLYNTEVDSRARIELDIWHTSVKDMGH
jgi:hypothetical protein